MKIRIYQVIITFITAGLPKRVSSNSVEAGLLRYTLSFRQHLMVWFGITDVDVKGCIS